jgi:replicative DNA helicase
MAMQVNREASFNQAWIISTLFLRNAYIPKLSIKPEMMDYPYSKYLQLCIKSYEQKQYLDLDYVLQNLNPQESSDFLGVLQACPNDAYPAFVHYEKSVYESYIKRTIDKECERWKNGEISLDEFRRELDLPAAYDTDVLNFDDLKNTLTTEQRALKLVGYPNIRNMANLKETDLLVIGACTGKGKSALALNLLEDLSRNYPCTYINMEMGVASVHKRMIAIHTGIPIDELERFKYLPPVRQDEILKASKFINERHITLVNSSQNINSIREIISSHNNEHHVIFVDHIGLIRSPGNSLYERMTYTAKELRKMSLDYNATIIALCQLSRQAAQQKKPDLNMLRDSGEIEQSATKVMLLYSEDTGSGEKYYIDIAKNRDGRTGTIPITFTKNNQKIIDD